MLTEVFAVHQRVQALLRSGKQRLYQTRELYHLDADLIAPVMNLAPEYSMATITAYTTQIEKRLQRRRFLRDSTAVAIRSRVHEFNAKALSRSGRGSG